MDNSLVCCRISVTNLHRYLLNPLKIFFQVDTSITVYLYKSKQFCLFVQIQIMQANVIKIIDPLFLPISM